MSKVTIQRDARGRFIPRKREVSENAPSWVVVAVAMDRVAGAPEEPIALTREVLPARSITIADTAEAWSRLRDNTIVSLVVGIPTLMWAHHIGLL
jgi:hypothetical protein